MITVVQVLAASVAFAQSESEGPVFMEPDADAHGRISKAEAQADSRVAKRFQEAETNKDGYLSLEEFTALRS